MKQLLRIFESESRFAALAVIIGQEGALYRPLGAMMFITADGKCFGHISSGCIEADVIARALSATQLEIVRYGKGSQFADLTMPCGGGMDVLILPHPDMSIFKQVSHILKNRESVTLNFNLKTGALHLSDKENTSLKGDGFSIALQPQLKFFIFGNGQEAQSFAELVQGSGDLVELFSTHEDTLKNCTLSAEQCHYLPFPKIPEEYTLDKWVSVTLFFHEHELEERILMDALASNAFYIGAQGSVTSHYARLQALKVNGISEKQLSRIIGPIGLIQKVRDPETLAISVLAEIHKIALEKGLKG